MAISVVIVDVRTCKNRCLFCNPNGRPSTSLSPERLRSIESAVLAQVINLKQRGFDEIEISGSDPIEYSKIVPFIYWLKNDMSFKFVLLLTHGRDLRRKTLVKELAASGLNAIQIPIYGSAGFIHDRITNVKGSFRETLEGLDNLKKYAKNIRIEILSMITGHNYKDIIEIFTLASRYAPIIRFGIPGIPDIPAIDGRPIMVNFRKLKPYLLGLLKTSDKTGARLIVNDIPFCILGFYRPDIVNRTSPPITSQTYSIPDDVRSPVPGLPSYRVKRRIALCNDCEFSVKCDGFFSTYLDLGCWVPVKKRIKGGRKC